MESVRSIFALQQSTGESELVVLLSAFTVTKLGSGALSGPALLCNI